MDDDHIANDSSILKHLFASAEQLDPSKVNSGKKNQKISLENKEQKKKDTMFLNTGRYV